MVWNMWRQVIYIQGFKIVGFEGKTTGKKKDKT